MSGFWQSALQNPSRLALVAPDGTRHTAGALLAEVNQLVHGLRAAGLQPGDTVAAVLPNCVAMVELALATAQAGLYLTPINHHLAPPEIAYIVEDSEAKAEVRDAGELAKRKAGQPETLPSDRRAGQVMNYTSGTTGRPKGVRRPLRPRDPDSL